MYHDTCIILAACRAPMCAVWPIMMAAACDLQASLSAVAGHFSWRAQGGHGSNPARSEGKSSQGRGCALPVLRLMVMAGTAASLSPALMVGLMVGSCTQLPSSFLFKCLVCVAVGCDDVWLREGEV